MRKPQLATRDKLLDAFDAAPLDIQETLLEQFALIHRLARRRARGKDEDSIERAADAPLLEVQKP